MIMHYICTFHDIIRCFLSGFADHIHTHGIAGRIAEIEDHSPAHYIRDDLDEFSVFGRCLRNGLDYSEMFLRPVQELWDIGNTLKNEDRGKAERFLDNADVRPT